MSADAPRQPLIRRAMMSDLPRLGRLGALLVEAHHELDSQRFLAPNDRTPANYASFLKTKLEDRDAAILVAEAHGDVIGYATPPSRGTTTHRCAGRRASCTTSSLSHRIAAVASVGCS